MKGTDRYRVEDVTCELGERVLRVVNMSVSGLFVECATPPPPGTGVKLNILLAGPPPVNVVGSVTWINEKDRPRNGNLPPGFGFRMQRVSFPAKMAILGHLRKTDPAALRDR